MRHQLVPAFRAVLLFTVLCGIAYPLLVLGIGQAAFGEQANGSLVRVDGQIVGSSLLGQRFTEPEYLHPRPSAAGDASVANDWQGYDASASSGSNLGPSDDGLLATVAERAVAYREENGLAEGARVPVDAVTASGSGLDPQISVANARLQATRIAEARDLDLQVVLGVIDDATTHRPLGILGDDGVDVLEANLALDALGS